MDSRTTRLTILGTIMGAMLVLLIARLWWLQLTRWSEYTARAVGNRTQVAYKAAPRGLIRDQHGRVLAENRDVWGIRVIPAALPGDDAALEGTAQFLTSVLCTDEAPVALPEVRDALLEARRTKAVEAAPLGSIGQDLSFDQVAAIEERRIEHPGLIVVTTTRRHYPYGGLAAHAVGYTKPVDTRQYERIKEFQYPPDPADATNADPVGRGSDPIYAPDSVIGAEGVEEAAELWRPEMPEAAPLPVLPGRRGRTVYEVDATGALQRLIAERRSRRGAEVHVTLDARVQHVAEQALREAIGGRADGMGAAVVLDVNTGDVVVLASEPSVDLNDWVGGLSAAQWERIQQDRGLPLLNKALRAYPPGSVFKVVSVCAAMETTGARPTSSAHCKGRITVGRRHETFRCWAAARGGHGTVNLVQAIARSCNIFFYDCVMRFNLHGTDIARYARRFGLGETTGLGLRGEAAGQVPDPEFDRPWRLGNSLNYVIGQDRLTTTPLQMAVVCAAIANGGTLVTPRIIRRIAWPGYLRGQAPEQIPPEARALEAKKETVEVVRRGMRTAVSGEHGTAGGLRALGISAAGKTGSAQYHPRHATHAWFIGFAPYDNPRYALCVFVGGGGTGAEVAVPIAARIFRALFDLHEPDDPAFALPPPMDPATAASKRRERIAAARAWAAAQPPASEGE